MKKILSLALSFLFAFTLMPAFADEDGSLSTTDTVLNQNFPANGVKKIEIKLYSEAVTVLSSSEEALNVTVKSNYQDKNPLVLLDGKTLKISQPEKKIKYQDRDCQVTITLPAKMKVSELDISTASGNITFVNLPIDKVEVETVSGTINADYVNAAKEFSLEAGDGSVNITGVTTKELEVEVKKGNLEIGPSEVRTFSVKCEKGTASLSLNKEFAKESSLETSNGTINLTLPAKTVLNTKTTIGKGNFHSDFATDTNGLPLKVKLGNGNVNITKK